MASTRTKVGYRVSFRFEGERYTLRVGSVDYDHPYFINLSDLQFERASALVLTPDDDAAEKKFGDAERLMVPIQSIDMIVELSKNAPRRHGLKAVEFRDEETDNGEESEDNGRSTKGAKLESSLIMFPKKRESAHSP